MEIKKINIKPPEDVQIIIAQSHFIKTVEDVYECLMNSVPNIEFGLAFCEASGPCLVRYDGNNEDLKKLASQYAYSLSVGHSLVILMKNAFPINILSTLRSVPEIVNIYCATANPIEILYVETEQGRGIISIIDGYKSKGIEDTNHIKERKEFLRNIGYKK